jgi:hypothetical protein
MATRPRGVVLCSNNGANSAAALSDWLPHFRFAIILAPVCRMRAR